MLANPEKTGAQRGGSEFFPRRKGAHLFRCARLYARMNTAKILPPIAALLVGTLAGCVSSPTRSSTVIQPPAPPGLPRPPALRIPNPPGAPEPPTLGDVVRVEHEPPVYAPPEEAPATGQPAAGMVWVPGHYTWQASQYAWVPGAWRQPPEGRSTWVPPHWEKSNEGYLFTEGMWR